MLQAIHFPLARRLFNHGAVLLLSAAALLASAAAWADPPGRVGRMAEVIGTVWMFDAEQGEWIAAQRNRPLTGGDRLSAERGARAELQIGSATLRLDGSSELEVTELDDDHVRLHLHAGSLALRLRANESAREFAVTTPEGRFEPLRSGHYRIDRRDDGSLAGVIGGALRFEGRDSVLELTTGQRAEFWLDRGVTHYSWSQLPNDRFADWLVQQDREDERTALARQRYVSPEMTGADDLDRWGDWDRHPEYGALWLPRAVAPGWAPYRYGHWAHVRPWGWTWVDDAPWGFAPFHYGRWVWWRDRWAWTPGQYVARPVYAPALVAWIGGPQVSIGINIGGPAVGWVPLSPREAYLPSYSVTHLYINRVNDPYRRWHPPIRPNQPVRTGPIMYSNQGVPGGVTVVPQQVLRERQPISSAVIAPVDAQTIQRWRQQPLGANGERRGNDAAPPPPASRVIAVPGGAVPAAPGAGRATPWGRMAPVAPAAQPATVAPAPAQRRGDGSDSLRDRAPQGDGRGAGRGDPRGQAPQADGRNQAPQDRAVTSVPVQPYGTPAQRDVQREAQERREQGRGHERAAAPPQRRIAPAPPAAPVQAVPPQPVQPVLPAQQPQQPQQPQPAQPPRAGQPVPGVRPAPGQAAPAAVAPVPRVPGRDEPASSRGRNAKDADARDERQPPGQDRRKRDSTQ